MNNSNQSTGTKEELKDITLSSPIWIGKKKVSNRVVHQAMECNDSFKGFPSELTLKRYRRLAEGRAGITVVESTNVSGTSMSRLHELIGDEKHRAGIEKLTNEFKKINFIASVFWTSS